MILRLATMADAELLLQWRNDPATRAMSHNTGEVGLTEHVAWLERVLVSPLRKLYVAELERPVGTLRADVDLAHGCIELSWTVAPDARGCGIGREMVRALAAMISAPIRAEVKTNNVASQRISEAAGMVLRERVGDVLHYFRP